MSADIQLMFAAFLGVASLILLVALLAGRRRTSQGPAAGGERAGEMFPEGADELFGESNTVISRLMMPAREEGRRKIGDRLVQAGLYRQNSLPAYLTLRVLLVLIPVALVVFAASIGQFTLKQGLLIGLGAGIAGTIAPGFWLDAQRNKRQTNIRRALPDALDILVVCVEGGLSLPAALSKVTSELQTAHPLLAHEMAIVQREVQLGATTGEALRHFAQRFDLDELRGLATVVSQAERFGSSVVRALRVHADSLRERRQMHAEELAAKAAVKLLIPTIVCIFPALMIVIGGPAFFDILELFQHMSGR